MISAVQILKLAVEQSASDVHLTSGSPPVLRINGDLTKVNFPPLTAAQVKELCYSLISDEQKSRFENEKNLDFSFFVKDLGRFRGALMMQKASVAGVIRLLKNVMPTVTELNLPVAVEEVINYPHGLVLVTGPTGSGKTTTLSAFINKINLTRRKHIFTIEDPIEVLYKHEKSIVSQRELGVDCHSFSDGLKSAMRLDPDVCLVGEMRDKETVESVLKLAETGHLMFSTLHTNSAAKSIDRILGMFNNDQKENIQNQISTVLRAIVSQRLVLGNHGKMYPAVEIMIVNPAIRNLIREGKFHQIENIMQTASSLGMQTMDAALVDGVAKGKFSSQQAFAVTSDKANLHKLFVSKNIKIA